MRPKLDYSALEPGDDASDAIRKVVKEAALDPAHGVTVRLTGSVQLSDEEFASLADRAGLMVTVMLSAVLLMLWLAVRSVRVTAAIMVCTIIGLVITAGLGLAVVGRFNLISVAFIPLFVGLGVDFGIQFAVRYRAESRVLSTQDEALIAAGRDIGGSIALAAAAIAAGFFAFLPTHYVGVSELGVIAGIGMVVAFVLAISLLPALLHVVRPDVRRARGGIEALVPLDNFMTRRRKLVLIVNGALALICVGLIPFLQFDANPLDLKNPHSESMTTLNSLMKDPDQSPNTIDVLTPSLAAADALSDKLDKLPQVAHAVTLSSFIPDDQAAKMAAITDADQLLDLTLNPLDTQPPPSDADLVAALRQTATALRDAAATDTTSARSDAVSLAASLERLANSDAQHRQLAQTDPRCHALEHPVQPATADAAGPAPGARHPAARHRQPVGSRPTGQARIEVFPDGRAAG